MKIEIRTEVKLITPELAALLLQKSQGNRPIKEVRVQQYAKSILDGTFCLNGESIVIGRDANGTEVLLDGHHRLQAVVATQNPIQSIVVSGVPASTWNTID